MKIAIVGTGYVGLSLAILLAKKEEVFALDIDEERVNLINKKISPFEDNEIEEHLKSHELDLTATINKKKAFENAHFIIIATPTNYDEEKGTFDTSSVENVIKDAILINKQASIVIKSTIPMGFTEHVKVKFDYNKIVVKIRRIYAYYKKRTCRIRHIKNAEFPFGFEIFVRR